MMLAESQSEEVPRKPFSCPAWITVSGKILVCNLIDLSETGAGLSFKYPDQIPDSFTLHLANRETVAVPCHVISRNDTHVSVAFFKKPEAKSDQSSEPRPRLELKA